MATEKINKLKTQAETIGIDLGNFNVKTSNKVLFRATYTTEAEGYVTGTEKTIEFDDETYYIEKGEFDLKTKKSSKETLPLFLYALAQATKKTTKEVNVVLGIPVDQLKDKEEMQSRFKKEFTFKVNGQTRNIKVRNVLCFPECVGASFAIADNVPKFEYVLLDLGGLISNIALFQDGKHVKSGSIPSGTLSLISSITKEINKEHGLNKTPTQMFRYLVNNHLETVNGKIDLEPYRKKFFIPYVKNVFTKLENEYEGLTTPIYVLGGGLEMLKPYIIEYLKKDPRFKMSPFNDAIFLNALGFKVIGDNMQWK